MTKQKQKSKDSTPKFKLTSDTMRPRTAANSKQAERKAKRIAKRRNEIVIMQPVIKKGGSNV